MGAAHIFIAFLKFERVLSTSAVGRDRHFLRSGERASNSSSLYTGPTLCALHAQHSSLSLSAVTAPPLSPLSLQHGPWSLVCVQLVVRRRLVGWLVALARRRTHARTRAMRSWAQCQGAVMRSVLLFLQLSAGCARRRPPWHSDALVTSGRPSHVHGYCVNGTEGSIRISPLPASDEDVANLPHGSRSGELLCSV